MTESPRRDAARAVTLITGATSATGRDLATHLAGRGHDLALGWRSKGDACEALAETCRAAGARVYCGRLDVTDETGATQFVRDALAALGRIDGLANVASWAAPGGAYRVRLADLDLADVLRACEVDLVGTLRMIRLCTPPLRASGAGAIVNYSSESALRGDPDLHVYLGAKVAVSVYTLALARELGPEVRINCIAPGAIATDWITSWDLPPAETEALAAASCVGRLGTPGDLSLLAAFLLSRDSSFITGRTFPVDGGLFCP